MTKCDGNLHAISSMHAGKYVCGCENAIRECCMTCSHSICRRHV